MRIFTTLFCILFLSFAASAQFVIVNSPASIAGSKAFSAATFGAVLTTGVWTGDAVFVDNGTATPTLGCDTVMNASAIAGKIALVDRGTCSFSEKVARAEAAGAIAVVVFNHTAGAGTIPMGVTAGFTVTIPAVMLSYEDGQIIRTTMMTQTVNITIGNVQFDNDIRITNERILNFSNGVMPANQAEAAGMSFVPGASVLNRGLNDASDVSLEGNITHTPLGGGTASQVYNESDNVAFLENDSAVLIKLPEYVPAEGTGVYDVTYTIDQSVDDSPEVNNDQEATTQFVYSENVYSKARWDFANNRPIQTNAYRRSAGTEVEFLAAFPVPLGLGYKLDSMQFYISCDSALNTLPAGVLQGFVYEWEDLNGDVSVSSDEFTIFAYSEIDLSDYTTTSAWIKSALVDYEELEGPANIPGDNKQYVLGIRYNGAVNAFIGFDEGYDHTAFLDNTTPINDLDLPYFLISAWDSDNKPDLASYGLFTDNASSLAAALYLGQAETPNIEVAPVNVSVTLSPNPATSMLVVESQLKSATGDITYLIRDNAGRLVYSSSKTLNSDYDMSSFDVSKYAAGQYFIVVTTDQGIKAERFTVQH